MPEEKGFCGHRQQHTLCFPWSAYPPGREIVFLSQLWLALPVSSGATYIGRLESWVKRDGWHELRGRSKARAQLGWAEACRQSAWEMVSSELTIWGVQMLSLSMKVVGMAG